MVTLSCLMKKNQNFNSRKKKFSLLLKMEIYWKPYFIMIFLLGTKNQIC